MSYIKISPERRTRAFWKQVEKWVSIYMYIPVACFDATGPVLLITQPPSLKIILDPAKRHKCLFHHCNSFFFNRLSGKRIKNPLQRWRNRPEQRQRLRLPWRDNTQKLHELGISRNYLKEFNECRTWSLSWQIDYISDKKFPKTNKEVTWSDS